MIAMTTTSRSAEQRNLGLTALALWLLLALAVGASGLTTTWQPPTPQIVIVTLTALALLLAFRVSPLHDWVAALDLRWLVAVHLTRFVGFYFLVLYDRGELPRAFGLYGGWGDISVATLAILLLLFVNRHVGKRERLFYLAWNVIGLVDILGVVIAATRAFIGDSTSMAPLLRLPLALLPTFIVPLVIATHVVMILRLRSEAGASDGPT